MFYKKRVKMSNYGGHCGDHSTSRTEQLSICFENLLLEAVELNSYNGVEMLLHYEMMLKAKMVER